jgi:hypothetical protein
MEKFIDYIAKMIAGGQVIGDEVGAVFGAIAWIGGFLAGNVFGQTSAGVALPASEGKALEEQAEQVGLENFQEQDLAYRLLNPEDPRSLAGQFIDQQTPDPTANVARVATGLLTMGRNMGAMIFRPLIWKAGAAGEYDYGRERVAMHPAELSSTDATVEDPFTNADMASDILDENNDSTDSGSVDNYINRAKMCFGTEITKVTATTSTGEAFEMYTVLPPSPGVPPPTYKNLADPDNKCDEGEDDETAMGSSQSQSMQVGNKTIDFNNVADQQLEINTISPWQRIRMFIMASNTMNAWACNMGFADDTIAQQACVDTGANALSGAAAQ